MNWVEIKKYFFRKDFYYFYDMNIQGSIFKVGLLGRLTSERYAQSAIYRFFQGDENSMSAQSIDEMIDILNYNHREMLEFLKKQKQLQHEMDKN